MTVRPAPPVRTFGEHRHRRSSSHARQTREAPGPARPGGRLPPALARVVSDPVLLRRVKAFIDARLADPELTPEQVAVANHVSTRQLYRLFETEGTTVARWIRDRRLERCRRDLIADGVGVGVGVVGARWGMPDSSYFSRVFRQTYGCPPREYRRAAGVG
ncbi:Transcriptional regulator [Saccharothrix espanaensis DSM 44229]|uniref:Transcriptional regulator n=1 Tax=Saccharothrix espanaensis (strain ATCC 51144 / DSM 44229 / JCM 9112 / NBRC 15066 / NRRL 15764) TaxID=1179773 RepID=K0K389_SACES|nr:Transcriptional regulator [Saccharothrix espanaensis DSM 44229]